ncbi:MAG: RIP metalloprotease RseP [Paludibacter sp.]|jgi:regulator of sigma E protease|nr:RIP metalloprotease RseP [Paludibacter sp.]
MESFLIKALQLILSLSILVVLHEFGHFFFARIAKIRVEKFYMFFNPKFSLVRAKKINGKWQVRFFSRNVPANERPKKDEDGCIIRNAKDKPIMELIPLAEMPEDDWRKYPDSTEWGIGWLPLGGYCKIAGMIDESMDTLQIQQEPQAWEYRSKSVWQRLPVITGGVLVNFLLGMALYATVLFVWGKEYVPLENASYGLQFSQTMLDNGFRNGDKIISIAGKSVENSADISESVIFDGKKDVVALRGGQQINIQLPADFIKQIMKNEESGLFQIRFPFVVEKTTKESPASAARLQAGDSITGINDRQLFIYQDIAQELSNHKNSEITLHFIRNGKAMQTQIALKENGKLGVYAKTYLDFFKTKKIEYGFFEAIPAGIAEGWHTLTNYVSSMKLVFSKEGVQQLGGFGSLGSLFPSVWDWQSFWVMTALLSIILAFMNILPIPALDGGHVMFLLYEMITGKKPGEKFLEQAQTVGMILLVALLIYANGNDVFRLFNK